MVLEGRAHMLPVGTGKLVGRGGGCEKHKWGFSSVTALRWGDSAGPAPQGAPDKGLLQAATGA